MTSLKRIEYTMACWAAAMVGSVVTMLFLFDRPTLYALAFAGCVVCIVNLHRTQCAFERAMNERRTSENQIMRRWLLGWITEEQAVKELEQLR